MLNNVRYNGDITEMKKNATITDFESLKSKAKVTGNTPK